MKSHIYGEDSFGQGCIAGRRLVENNVRYVEVNLGGLGHTSKTTSLVRLSVVLCSTKAFPALLQIWNRGMLDETLVV